MDTLQTVKETKETPEELSERLLREAKVRKEAMLASREAAKPKSRKERREKALAILMLQLERGTKPVKGRKPFKMKDGSICWHAFADIVFPQDVEWSEVKDKDGNTVTKKAVRLNYVPLEYNETIKVETQIVNLKAKLERA